MSTRRSRPSIQLFSFSRSDKRSSVIKRASIRTNHFPSSVRRCRQKKSSSQCLTYDLHKPLSASIVILSLTTTYQFSIQINRPFISQILSHQTHYATYRKNVLRLRHSHCRRRSLHRRSESDCRRPHQTPYSGRETPYSGRDGPDVGYVPPSIIVTIYILSSRTSFHTMGASILAELRFQ